MPLNNKDCGALENFVNAVFVFSEIVVLIATSQLLLNLQPLFLFMNFF